MAGRLRKAINHQRRMVLQATIKKAKEYTIDYGENIKEPPSQEHSGKLPYPRRLLRTGKLRKSIGAPVSTPQHTTGRVIKSSAGATPDSCTMMHPHCLWVRLFDKQDRLLFNHTDYCSMHTSQMIYLCTKLVNHLNLISQTNELEVQKALGTLEGTIIAQLTPPSDGKAQYHAWNLQNTDNVYYDIGAIAIIRQNKDRIFEGQLIDDFVNTTFQLQ